MKKTQFMVCPYTDATQSGVIMSSFTFGTPVIATKVGGLPEMLGNGKYGMLVKEKTRMPFTREYAVCFPTRSSSPTIVKR